MKAKHCYDYPRPSVTTDNVIFKNENGVTKLLLIKRKNEPFKGMWAFPGGFLDMDEDSKTGAARELKEETNIDCDNLVQFYIADAVDRDPRGRIISIIYTGYHFGSANEATAMDDAVETGWHSILNLPQLAADHLDILHNAALHFYEGIKLNTQKFKYICNRLTSEEKQDLLQDFKYLLLNAPTIPNWEGVDLPNTQQQNGIRKGNNHKRD